MLNNPQGQQVQAGVPEQAGILGALVGGGAPQAAAGATPEQQQMVQANATNPMQRFMLQLQDPDQRNQLAQQLAASMPPPPQEFLAQFETPARIMPTPGVAATDLASNTQAQTQANFGELINPQTEYTGPSMLAHTILNKNRGA